mmetsp:Transcript_73923/g.133256  ORF Transcript_73923/g.133256 Transcript_73923/m.133256 type:complete len:188 (+) Transcript_73923:1-564(+)
MEALNPTAAPASDTGLLEGDWRLIYASEDVTRSSPFFWGWRKMLKGIRDPTPVSLQLFGTEEISESIFAFTDGIPIRTVGEATQSIKDGRLISRVTIQVFGFGQTVMTTSCRFMPANSEGSELAVTVETTQAMGSTLPFADTTVFPSEALLGESARIIMHLTYLDDDLRIMRNDADGQVFVYARTAE